MNSNLWRRCDAGHQRPPVIIDPADGSHLGFRGEMENIVIVRPFIDVVRGTCEIYCIAVARAAAERESVVRCGETGVVSDHITDRPLHTGLNGELCPGTHERISGCAPLDCPDSNHEGCERGHHHDEEDRPYKGKTPGLTPSHGTFGT